MNFISIEFFAFFLIVFFIYWHISNRYQNYFLIITSCVFYAYWDWRFLSLIFLSIAGSYICGNYIFTSSSAKQKKFWLTLSIVLNIGILCYFKYANFFIDSMVSTANFLGWHISDFVVKIVLPIGISFYTFQSLTYPMDIYSGKLIPAKSIINFAVYVSFFPKLIAGPIVRARDFIYQVEEERLFKNEDFEEGCIRFLTGLFKKAVIADTIAIHIVNPVFSDPASFSAGSLWFAMVGYSIQIYADFSGYSNMAIGISNMLGFKISENFLFPYISVNFSDFWRRWHITMSTFFRDYVYIPLGGNRCSTIRRYFNLLLTMLICGLWHGAAWTFIFWGGMHGLYLIIYHSMSKAKNVKKTTTNQINKNIQILFSWGATQLFVCFAWIVFRADSFSAVWQFFKGLFLSIGSTQLAVPSIIWFCIIAFVFDHCYGWLEEHQPKFTKNIPVFIKAALYTSMIIIAYNTIPGEESPFIYFQF